MTSRRLTATEDDILVGVIQWLVLLKPQALYFHVPNESKSYSRNAAAYRRKMKEKGVLAGVPDLIFMAMPRREIGCIELKAKTGSMTQGQREFRDRCAAGGVHYHLVRARDVADAIEQIRPILRDWGAI